MKLLTTDEVSDKLGIKVPAFHALRYREKTFPQPIRISTKVLRWDEADIDAWLNKRKEAESG